MLRGSRIAAASLLIGVLALLASLAAIVAMLPRLLSPDGAAIEDIVGDAGPWLVILAIWLRLANASARSGDALWALPSHLFRAAVAAGVPLVLLARSADLVPRIVRGVAARTLIVTSVEDVLYGLGVVALAALAAFAAARTLLRPVLGDRRPPPGTRDITPRTRFVVASTGAAFATAGVLLDVLVDFERTSDTTLAGFLVTAAALVASAATIGWLVGDDMARRDEALTAARSERDRIARELHDGVAKSMSVLALEAATIADRAPAELRSDLARIERLARLLSEELRAIVKDVRSRDDGEPLDVSLGRMAETYGASLRLDGELERVGTLARFEILRIVEEALRNAESHARARELAARVGIHDGRVRVEIEDDGEWLGDVPWDDLAREGRFGLIGIRERTALLRGELRVERGTRGGTLLRVEFPVRAG